MASGSTPVGRLACQLNSSLQQLATRVVSCTKVDAPPPPKGASTRTKDQQSTEAANAFFYEVVCADSVLFPEGGGQPCDLGTVAGVPVVAVQRRGDTCVIKTAAPLEVGAEVEQVVDWPRRVDHMQHHSGQHLLTAVIEKELGLPTESWALSTPTCYLQLPTAQVPEEGIAKVEEICNNLIRDATPIAMTMYETRADVPEARSRSIPADVTGPIRLITVDGVDTCTCCGTHYDSLAHLKCLKILHQEKKGQTCKLHFIFGDRVMQQFTAMYDRERSLQGQLGLPPAELVDGIKRIQKTAAEVQKSSKKLLSEVAALVAPNVAKQAASEGDATPFIWHREDADMDFLGVVAAALGDAGVASVGEPAKSVSGTRVCLLACGSVKAVDGQFLIVGPSPDSIKALADEVCGALNGKGGLSKQGFRGKADMTKWKAFIKARSAKPTTAAS
jgi:alanyl-tRNA synthetase/misacylated tRNA(Ala) deacylase